MKLGHIVSLTDCYWSLHDHCKKTKDDIWIKLDDGIRGEVRNVCANEIDTFLRKHYSDKITAP